MKNFIKEWWDKLPEANSGPYELDKTILRALFKEIKSTLIVSLLGFIADVVEAGAVSINTGDFKLEFKFLLIAFITSTLENVGIFIRKFKKDYTK